MDNMIDTLLRYISDSVDYNTLIDFVTSKDMFIYLLGTSSIGALCSGIRVCWQALKRPVIDASQIPKKETAIAYFFHVMAHAPNFAEKVKDLVAKNPDIINFPYSAETNEYTPFLYSCYWSPAADLICFMLEKGADVRVTTAEGETPLYLAAYRASKEKDRWDPSPLDLLLEAGCDINAATRAGNTPLHIAAKEGHVELTRFLLQRGANPEIANHAGVKPCDVARIAKRSRAREDYTSVTQLLEGCVDDMGASGLMTSSDGSLERVEKSLVPRFFWDGECVCEMYTSQV